MSILEIQKIDVTVQNFFKFLILQGIDGFELNAQSKIGPKLFKILFMCNYLYFLCCFSSCLYFRVAMTALNSMLSPKLVQSFLKILVLCPMVDLYFKMYFLRQTQRKLFLLFIFGNLLTEMQNVLKTRPNCRRILKIIPVNTSIRAITEYG